MVQAENERNQKEKYSSASQPNGAATKPTDELPPIYLQFGVLFLSGILFVFCLRDFLTTGKVIAGAPDAAYLVCSRYRAVCHKNQRDGNSINTLHFAPCSLTEIYEKHGLV